MENKQNQPIIKFDKVSKHYGSQQVLHSVSFEIKANECMALLGPNGAGKTTIVRILLDFSRASGGQVTIDNVKSTNAAARKKLGYVAENHRVPPFLSGKEYLARTAELLGIRGALKASEIPRVLEICGMKGKEQNRIATYSKGMTQRIALAAALLGSPKILVLDEPTTGLDPIGIREIRLILESIKNQGVTVLLNSHILSEVEKICDTAAIIRNGQILVKDRIENLITADETLEDVFIRIAKS